MAIWLLLEDFAGNIGGPTNVQLAQAGTLFDDTQFNVPSLISAGMPLVPYVPATMAAPVAAFQKMSGGLAQINPDGNLLALLFAAGAFGGGGTVGPATSVYVAPPPLGNDATGVRGDASKPFATLDAAFAAMQDGDQVLLAPGNYAALSATISPTLTNGSVGTWVNDSQGQVQITSPGGPCFDFSGATRGLWRISGTLLSSPTGTDAILADGAAAPPQTYFTSGALVLSNVTLISGGLSVRYAGVFINLGLTMVSPNEAIKLITCDFVFNSKFRGFAPNLTYQITDDNDDPLSPTGGGSQLQAKLFDGSCVHADGTLALEMQGSIGIAPGAFMSSIVANALTRPVINPAWISLIEVYAHLGGDVTIQALPNGVANYGFVFQGMTLNGDIIVEMDPGAFGTRVNLCGATIEGTGFFGEGVTANLRDSDWQGGLLASVTTGGSNGNIIPPTFAMGPVQTAVPTQFDFPFRVNSGDYSVAVDGDTLANLPAAVTVRTNVGFEVTPTAAAANTFLRAIVSFYGN